MESAKSFSRLSNHNVPPENSKWLAENLEEVNQSVKKMLKLIQDDADSSAKKTDIYYQKSPELIANVEEFCSMYRLLAEFCDQFNGESHTDFPSFQVQHSGISDPGSYQTSLLLTPDQKLGLHKSEQAVGLDFLLSSGGGTSESSSLLSSDSDSESLDSINKHSVLPANGDGKGLHQRIIELETELPGIAEAAQVTKQENVGNGGNHILLGRITEYEKERRVSSKKLRISEEEIARLKGELKKNESVTTLMGNLHAELESAQKAIEMREAALGTEKRKVLELQKRAAELEAQILVSNCKIETLEEELETREKLGSSEKERAGLEHEISDVVSKDEQLQGQLELIRKDFASLETKLYAERSQILELQERIPRYIADVSNRDNEINELNAALDDAHERFSLEKAQFESKISRLIDQHTVLETRIEACEFQNEMKENVIRRSKAEIFEMKVLHEAQKVSWQAELNKRGEVVEALNKNIDTLNVQYDMVRAEKDGLISKLRALGDEVCCRDIQIRKMEDRLLDLHLEHTELIAVSENARGHSNELKLRVEELEKEVERQRVVISDRAEEKREAIRQLCFSVEHYKSGYQELRQAYIRQK